MTKNFAAILLDWFDQHGRKDLPWQDDADPYRIWLSEIMLQQTQVSTVIPYFERFCERFPSVQDLAGAQEDEVLHLWSGLGYYARARNLHHAAKQVVEEFGGVFPDQQDELESLKGIGRSTAAAIRAQAFGEKAAILDGNVKRVLARLFAIDVWPGLSSAEKQLWELSESLLPDHRLRDYTQAIMDFGATLCTRSKPKCGSCPLQSECIAFTQDRVEELPVRKPKKRIPLKETVFLIVANDRGEVLLEKRPPTGIWGGLWSFPESSEKDLEDHLVALGLRGKQINRLQTGEHAFSHYRLRFHPILVQSDQHAITRVEEGAAHVWFDPREPGELGLPAPIAKLLRQIDLI